MWILNCKFQKSMIAHKGNGILQDARREQAPALHNNKQAVCHNDTRPWLLF